LEIATRRDGCQFVARAAMPGATGGARFSGRMGRRRTGGAARAPSAKSPPSPSASCRRAAAGAGRGTASRLR